MMKLPSNSIPLCVAALHWTRGIHCSKATLNSKEEHPFKRTVRVLGNDLRRAKNFIFPSKIAELDEFMKAYEAEREFPRNCDVLIIGGGGIGASIAFWLKKKARRGLDVVVVEKNSTYKFPSTISAGGGLTQQFSTPENIQMSLFGAEFVRNSKEYLGQDLKINFTPHGHLKLVTEEGAEELAKNSKLQNEIGARNELLIPNKIKSKFPWINTDGIGAGCLGLEMEGWIDPYEMLLGFKNKATEYGAHFINGKVEGFQFRDQFDIIIVGAKECNYKALDKVHIKMSNGEYKEIKFAICIIAAGVNSPDLGRLANIGTGSGLLGLPIPVQPRTCNLHSFSLTPGLMESRLGIPMISDPSGFFFRRDGISGKFIAGGYSSGKDKPLDNFESIKALLANRVPAFQTNDIKCEQSLSGNYDYNTFDANGILGPHPLYHNLYVVTGFSRFGIQQTPAIGRAISELIIDGQFRTIDLERFGFDRIIVDKPLRESFFL